MKSPLEIFVKVEAKLALLVILMTYFTVLLYQARTEILSQKSSQSQVWISLGEQLY